METLNVLLLSGVVAFVIVWVLTALLNRKLRNAAERRLAELDEQMQSLEARTQAALQKPEPPCGDKHMHFVVAPELGMPCPACAAKRAREARDREADAFAKKLAVAIADELARREKTEEKSHG